MILLSLLAANLSGEGFPASGPRRVTADLFQASVFLFRSYLVAESSLLKAFELAHALEKSRSIPLDQIASIALDHKRQIAFVQLHTGTEVQLEAAGFSELFEKLTELYSGKHAA